MSRAAKQKTPWEVQDLSEQLTLARAEQVKLERMIRDALRDPRNRNQNQEPEQQTVSHDAIINSPSTPL